MARQLLSADELSRLLERGVQLVDVLGMDEYQHDHIPGAINVPLKEVTASSVGKLDRTRPVAVYCNDFG